MMTGPENRTPFALRDLEWVINSPFLLKEFPEPDLARHPETKALLTRLRADPEPLLEHLATTPRLNLGRYFEQLVIFWLDNLPSVRLIGSNIPIFREKRTLGEIDLIFLYEGTARHWELSIKFYLNTGSPSDEADFVGPMLKDTLKRKLDRLYGHQLSLPDQTETIAMFKSLGIGDVTSCPWVKGCLFYPAPYGPTQPAPHRISMQGMRGEWRDRSRLTETPLPNFDHFQILEKKRWITPYFYPDEATTGTVSDLLAEIDKAIEGRPMPYLVHLMRDDGKEKLTSLGQLFITPEGWPD
ncbi:DUF1853 family protein [Sneathiella sp. HT1-7]|uniref:DUF1853 family protein n=1 Tax=Sneathiella sp. HT1-7 TaxID=2887192 RepID=UPI001D14722F|nr:DUF1853 family protein [Sneathiella sp. HT1-7]MCC3305784.1 DUF1853 family protein [Sneathiella sp. HT1-7]